MNTKTQQKLLEIVRNNYSEIAEEFNQTRKKYLWPELLKLSKLVNNGDDVLDVGCGNGRLFESFAEKNINYIGTDNSSKLIDFARKQNEIAKFRFIDGDILNLENIQGKYDYIFCIAVLHHVPGFELQLKALKNLKSKLKPDGKIVMTNWNLWKNKKFKNLLIRNYANKLLNKNKTVTDNILSKDIAANDLLFKWKNDGSLRFYHAFTKRELKKLIKKSALKIDSLYKDNYNYYLILGNR